MDTILRSGGSSMKMEPYVEFHDSPKMTASESQEAPLPFGSCEEPWYRLHSSSSSSLSFQVLDGP